MAVVRRGGAGEDGCLTGHGEDGCLVGLARPGHRPGPETPVQGRRLPAPGRRREGGKL